MRSARCHRICVHCTPPMVNHQEDNSKSQDPPRFMTIHQSTVRLVPICYRPPRKLMYFASDSIRLETDEPSAPQQVPRDCSPGFALICRTSSEQRRVSPDTNPSFDVVSSYLSPTIPLELWTPLSFLGAENLQVQISDTLATDLDMKSCVSEYGSISHKLTLGYSRLWLMLRLIKFGVQFSSKKMNALLHGDQSGAVVNRAFVCGAHVLGMMSSAGTDARPAMVQFHARRVQTAWESLAELFNGTDYRTCIHAAALVISSHVYMCMPQMALLYVQKTCEFIKKGGLQFTPTCGRPPEFSEELHETLGALSQAIYWANYLFLMRGGPEPHATGKLEREFRHALPVGESAPISLYTEFMSCHSNLTRSSLRSVL